MFNVSKKTLSLVLCLTLIASVVVFCFAGPASAVTTVKYPTYDSAVSLAAKPDVDLTFDGENRYGIPLHRGTGISYAKEGFVTSNTSGGWFFVGKSGEAIKDANGAVIAAGTVEKGKANSDHVAANYLYELEAGTEYRFVMDYKFLKGAKVAGINLGIAVRQNPNGDMIDIKGSKTVSGNAVVWNVNGVAQEVGATLTSDTDIQTMIATIVPKENGYLGLQNHSTASATIAIDSIKLYRLDSFNSSCQNPITFDNGGVDFGRYMGQYGYKTDDVDGNSNSYFWYDGTTDYGDDDKDGVWKPNVGTTTGSVYFSNYEYVKTWNANINDSYSYTRMYKFSPGSSYEITFKFRIANPKKYDLYDSRTNGESELKENKTIELGKTTITPCLAKFPAGSSSGVINLTAEDISNYVKDLYYNGLAIENAPGSGIWQTVRICFTLNDTATIDADGLYFGLRGGGFVTEIDDYNVRELINYSVKTFDARNVSLDFTDATTSSLGVTTAGANVTIEYDNTCNNYFMKVASTGNARISMNETRVLKRDKKYYISFDAKTDDGCADFNFVMGNPGNGGENYASANFRIFFNDIKGALDTSGSKFYIDGQEVNGYANFTPNGEWRHYGFTLNLDSATWNGKGSGDHTVGCNQWISLENGGGVYLLFGAGQTSGKSVCYDNIKISQFDEIANAVPATTGTVERDDYTKSYVNDFDSITTSDDFVVCDLNKYGNKAEVVKEEGRGNVVKLSGDVAARFTLKNSNVLEAGYKYTISFDAKLDPNAANDPEKLWLIISGGDSTSGVRYFLRGAKNDDSSGGKVLGAFKLYIGGEEVDSYKSMNITNEWKTYTIEFDYTNVVFDFSTIKNDSGEKLTDVNRYFHFGCANGWFDNLKIVKRSIGEIKDNTQVSVRKEDRTGENYVSAGLRFKNCLPNDVVEAADEVGFVVIPSSMAVTAPNSWYKLDGTGSASAQTVVCKNATMNQMYERTASETYYQLVLTGLSTESGKTAYNRRFSAVMYTKKGDAYTYYALGETSYNQVGAIKDVINAQ